VVQGCAPLAFDVRRWDFPIVGTVPYLGFFKEEEAHRYAAELKRDEKIDVWVRGAPAYSTLGWFNDPVLSTMLGDGPDAVGELADTILHESVHATVYVPGQSSFGESLASFVAEGLTPEWLVERFGADSGPVRAYAQSQERGARTVKELHETWAKLDALYRSKVDDATKLAEKERIFAALQRSLGAKRPLNNAAIAGFRTYSSGKEGFERLKAACGTWDKFLAAVKTLKPRDFNAPQQENFEPVLDALSRRQCPKLESRAPSPAPQ
jgi:predicted aminopeptidase